MSSTPVTVMVRAVFQFSLVNVTLAGETVPSPVLLDVREIETSAVGSESRTMVNVSSPAPASVVVSPLVGETVIPAVSLSSFDTEGSGITTPL